MRKIKCACIRYRLKSSPETERYITGANHAQCISWFAFADIPRVDRMQETEEQGFMTDAGDFVDRRTAYQIAKEAGQLVHERADETLFSEYIKYSQ